MTNQSVLHASRGTHAKIAFVALAVSAVFVTVVSASGSKTQVAGLRAVAPTIASSATMKIAASDRTLVR